MRRYTSLLFIFLTLFAFFPKPSYAATQIGLHKTLELVFTASVAPSNPFDTYLLRLEVTDPTGTKFEIDGFYDGDGTGGQTGNIWKARITPYRTGTWQWRTVTGDQFDGALVGLSGTFDAVASSDQGGLIASGQHFKFQNGDFLYLVGNFLDFTNSLRTTHTFMSETTTDGQRDAIIIRQRDVHTANKANIYFANRGDYSNQSVTPWLGNVSSHDKTRMDLADWKLYDGYIRRFKDNQILAEMWFFADDSAFGALPEADQKRLIRYGLARTSAFSHTMYVLALEWGESFTKTRVTALGNYFQQHNPWGRLVSVHNHTDWQFSLDTWPTFIATQVGNSAVPSQSNSLARTMRSTYALPHIDEEYGILNSDTDVTLTTRLRGNMWANFVGGAAGGGTGSDLKALQRFISQSKIPFYRMSANNSVVSGGGTNRFALSEAGHHYLIYSQTGAFTATVTGSNLKGYWFDPRNPSASLSTVFAVSAGTSTFTPPNNTTLDWVLWVSDGTNLSNGITLPTAGATMTSITVAPNTTITVTAPPTSTPTKTPTPTQPVSPTPAVNSIVGYWDLNEGIGQIATDVSNNGNDANFFGPTWTSGKWGSGISFDGVDDFVTVINTPLLTMTSGMTIAAWVKPTAPGQGSASRILSKRTTAGGSDVYALGLWNNSYQPFFRIKTPSGATDVIATSTIPQNTWTHLAATYDGTTMKLYINGTLSQSVAKTGLIESSTSDVHFGDRQDEAAGRRYQGVLDEMRLYNYALTSSQIQNLLTAGTPEGDVDDDGDVDTDDVRQLLRGYFQSVDDLTGDNKVNSLDIVIPLYRSLQ